MISDRNPQPTIPSPGEPPLDEMPDREPQGLTRGVVWSQLAAEMRAEAAAAGDDRFEKLDALLAPRRTDPYEAQPVDLARVRAERAVRTTGERAA